MKSSLRYVLSYLLLIQILLGHFVPTEWFYQHRVQYEIFKSDPTVLDLAIDEMKIRVDKEHLTEYVVILGDSVGYSGPGGPEQSMGAFMEQISQANGAPLRVFNLALPAMQMGDVYTTLLKLQRRGLRPRHVVINILYAGFVARNPAPPSTFWLTDDLKELDPESWTAFREQLEANDRVQQEPFFSGIIRRYVSPHASLLRYRGVLRHRLVHGLTGPGGEVSDTRPWREKPWLQDLVQGWQYQHGFNPTPFDMSERNAQIYFLQRLIALMTDGNLLIYLSPTNQELMKQNVTVPGYQENITRIERWFQGRPVHFVNLESAFDQRFFADHVHLTPEGYRDLAGILLERLQANGDK